MPNHTSNKNKESVVNTRTVENSKHHLNSQSQIDEYINDDNSEQKLRKIIEFIKFLKITKRYIITY